jgi:hypothetical protein
MTRHWFVTAFKTLAMPVMDAGPFVNAAGLPAHVALVCDGALVTPTTAISQTCVPGTMLTFDTLIVDGCVNVTVPTQPGERVTTGATVKRRPGGNVSVKAMPACAGEPIVLNRLNRIVAVSPGLMDSTANDFRNVGRPAAAPTVAVTALLVVVCDCPPICWLLDAVLLRTVPVGGGAAGTPLLIANAINKLSAKLIEVERRELLLFIVNYIVLIFTQNCSVMVWFCASGVVAAGDDCALIVPVKPAA